MIQPSEICLETLPWVPLDATSGFPEHPAIYFAIDSQNSVQYIGKSVNVRSRWKSHHRYEDLKQIGGVRIAYLFVDTPELLIEIESALISWFQPPLNIFGRPSRPKRSRPTDRVNYFVDISSYWLRDGEGEPKSVNSIFEEIKDTPDEVGRNTLRLALDGTLDRGHFSNLVKLARLCSKWSGKEVTPNDLLRIEE